MGAFYLKNKKNKSITKTATNYDDDLWNLLLQVNTNQLCSLISLK